MEEYKYKFGNDEEYYKYNFGDEDEDEEDEDDDDSDEEEEDEDNDDDDEEDEDNDDDDDDDDEDDEDDDLVPLYTDSLLVNNKNITAFNNLNYKIDENIVSQIKSEYESVFEKWKEQSSKTFLEIISKLGESYNTDEFKNHVSNYMNTIETNWRKKFNTRINVVKKLWNEAKQTSLKMLNDNLERMTPKLEHYTTVDEMVDNKDDANIEILTEILKSIKGPKNSKSYMDKALTVFENKWSEILKNISNDCEQYWKSELKLSIAHFVPTNELIAQGEKMDIGNKVSPNTTKKKEKKVNKKIDLVNNPKYSPRTRYLVKMQKNYEEIEDKSVRGPVQVVTVLVTVFFVSYALLKEGSYNVLNIGNILKNVISVVVLVVTTIFSGVKNVISYIFT